MDKDKEIIFIFSLLEIMVLQSFYRLIFPIIGMIVYLKRKNIKIFISFISPHLKSIYLKFFQLSLLSSISNKEYNFLKILIEIIFLLNLNSKIHKLPSISDSKKIAIIIIYFALDTIFLQINFNEFLFSLGLVLYLQIIVNNQKKSKKLKKLKKLKTSSKIKTNYFKDIKEIIDEFDFKIAILNQDKNKILANKEFEKENTKCLGSVFNDYIDASTLICGNSLNENFSIFIQDKHKNESKKYYKIKQGIKLKKKNYLVSISKLDLSYNVIDNCYLIIIKKCENNNGKYEVGELDQSISNIFNSISHQLLTPMNGLIGMQSTIKKNLPLNVKNDFKICQACCRILNNTILMMLDFSLLLVNKLVIQNELIEVKFLVKEINQMFKTQCKLKNIVFSLDLDQLFPKFIEVDYPRLKMLLFIFIENSIKHTDKGFVKIKLNFKDPDLEFCVQDSGIGIPQSKIDWIMHQDDIFNFKENCKKSCSFDSVKKPLGFLIALKLLKKMNSFLQIESVENKGTTMLFRLKTRFASTKIKENIEPKNHLEIKPLLLGQTKKNHINFSFKDPKMISSNFNLQENLAYKKNEHNEELKSIEKFFEQSEDQVCDEGMPNLSKILHKHITEKSPSPGLKKTLTDCNMLTNKFRMTQSKKEIIDITKSTSKLELYILIVDDELFNRMVLKSMIKKINISYLTKEVVNGKEAVDIVQSSPKSFSLIFMDLNMPIMGGIEATIKIRKFLGSLNIYIPIIALTAFKAEIAKDKCLKVGMDYFANKPLKIKELQDILNKYLNNE